VCRGERRKKRRQRASQSNQNQRSQEYLQAQTKDIHKYKIQNECSESFETRQGLRQGDVLSTLLFNVVLEVIVRRANLQTTTTIYNKETQLLAYADDIDIVGRSQSAVRNAYLALEEKAAKAGLK
jgi:DNA repair ATPase RecN